MQSKTLLIVFILLLIAISIHWLSRASQDNTSSTGTADSALSANTDDLNHSANSTTANLQTTTLQPSSEQNQSNAAQLTKPDSEASIGERIAASSIPTMLDPNAEENKLLLNNLQAMYKELSIRSYDQAIFIALDTLPLSADHPNLQILIYFAMGSSYEKLGLIDQAIAAHRAALAINSENIQSHNALRRLDPTFAANHPELTFKEVRRRKQLAEKQALMQNSEAEKTTPNSATAVGNKTP